MALASASNWKAMNTDDFTEEYCKENGVNVVTHFYYRLIQIIWIMIATIAIYNILRVYFHHIKSSKLHTNIRTILTLFLFSAIVTNLVTMFTEAYQLTLSFTFRHPCDVFLNTYFYIVFNILHGYTMEIFLLLKTAMALERILATLYVTSYEHVNSSIGIFGITIAACSAAAVELYIYVGVSLNEHFVAITSTLRDVSQKINNVLLFNVCCSAFTMMAMLLLLLVNLRRRKSAIGSVSLRYQIEENIATTKFIAGIAFVQLICFSIQSFGSLLVRLYSKYLFDPDDTAAMKSLKLGLHVIPLFTLIISIVIEQTIRSTASHRNARLQHIIGLKNDIKNNSKYLELQWGKIDVRMLEIRKRAYSG